MVLQQTYAINFRRNNEVQLASSKFPLLLSYQMYALYVYKNFPSAIRNKVNETQKYFVAWNEYTRLKISLSKNGMFVIYSFFDSYTNVQKISNMYEYPLYDLVTNNIMSFSNEEKFVDQGHVASEI